MPNKHVLRAIFITPFGGGWVLHSDACMGGIAKPALGQILCTTIGQAEMLAAQWKEETGLHIVREFDTSKATWPDDAA